jgi:hypothetical protein
MPSAADEGPSEDIMSRSFRRGTTGELRHGDNLAFDFRDEEAPEEEAAPSEANRRGEWEVGDEGASFGERGEYAAAALEHGARLGLRGERRKGRAPGIDEEDFIDEATAPVYNRGLGHSAGFFLVLFMFVGLFFGGLALAIWGAPAAAADFLSRVPLIGDHFAQPFAPARLVALRDVQSGYRQLRGGITALVITGSAENVGDHALHIVSIAASLRNASPRALASQTVDCGNNNLAAGMVGQMTAHEIEFYQKLEPAKDFAVEPSATCPFVIVFVDPPAGVDRFDISVAKALPAPSDEGTTTPGA